MSPEQASGDRALDARTDIYSLATVLYEMLAERPSSDATTATVLTPASATASRRVPLAAVTLLLGLLIGVGVLFAWRRGHVAAPRAGERFVAVLPFENVGSASDEYFADGITDAVRGKLSGIPGLEVIAGRSSAEYKKSDKSLTQIARDLGVTYLVVARRDEAVEQLEVHLARPSVLSRERLRIDPHFAPLRTNPRFRRLVGET
jgi:hypothetical protein